jgi:hypothetical protein
MKPGVKIYGGFDGSETDLSERDPEVNISTFSGSGFIHTVVGAEGALLDGIRIIDGRAYETGDNGRGGGLFVVGVSMTVIDCTFWSNDAGSGGGVYARNATLTFNGCTFDDNYADGLAHTIVGGSGLYIETSTVTMTECTVRDHICAGHGSGMIIYRSDVTATGCWFFNNAAGNDNGGAVYIDCSSAASRIQRFIDCDFEDNTAQYGGGMLNRYCSPVLEGCEFEGNRALQAGGAMWNQYCSFDITNTIFIDNTGDQGTAGTYNLYPLSGNPRFENCLFSGNSAGGYGSAMYNNNVSPEILNCTIANNSTSSRAGGINNVIAYPVIRNCIIWGNTDVAGYPQIYNDAGSSPTITHTDIGQTGFEGGEGNLNVDPLFVTGPLGEYYLSQTAAGQGSQSPCVDAGDNAADILGYNTLTTRTDQVADTLAIDLGYHYEIDN